MTSFSTDIFKMLTFIDNLNDENGLMNPGTNAWDLRGNAATVPAHTLMTDREFDEQFNAYDRTPVELLVSDAGTNAPRTPAVPMDELLASADQYTDIAQAGRYELNLANIADRESLPVNTLSAEQIARLIELIQSGDGMDDVDEQPSANSESFERFLDESMDASVRSEDVAVGEVEPVQMTQTSDRPLHMSDLDMTPIKHDASWIGRGALMLQTSRLPTGVHEITSPDGRVRTIGVV
jgi:hypothetical protein